MLIKMEVNRKQIKFSFLYLIYLVEKDSDEDDDDENGRNLYFKENIVFVFCYKR